MGESDSPDAMQTEPAEVDASIHKHPALHPPPLRERTANGDVATVRDVLDTLAGVQRRLEESELARKKLAEMHSRRLAVEGAEVRSAHERIDAISQGVTDWQRGIEDRLEAHSQLLHALAEAVARLEHNVGLHNGAVVNCMTEFRAALASIRCVGTEAA